MLWHSRLDRVHLGQIFWSSNRAGTRHHLGPRTTVCKEEKHKSKVGVVNKGWPGGGPGWLNKTSPKVTVGVDADRRDLWWTRGEAHIQSRSGEQRITWGGPGLLNKTSSKVAVGVDADRIKGFMEKCRQINTSAGGCWGILGEF